MHARQEKETTVQTLWNFCFATPRKRKVKAHCIHWQAPRVDAKTQAYQRMQFFLTHTWRIVLIKI